MLCCVVLCCIVLYCIVLYCVVLCCVVLCCVDALADIVIHTWLFTLKYDYSVLGLHDNSRIW